MCKTFHEENPALVPITVGYTGIHMPPLPDLTFLLPYKPHLLPALAFFAIISIIKWLMRPRRFYFVRHGETILNAAHIRQGDAGGLTPEGQSQAEATGRYLKNFRIRKMIVSPYERTRETAAIINKHLNVPIEYSPLFIERRNPSEIIGKKAEDPEVAKIVDQIDRSYHDDNFRYSDEENFQDLKSRAEKALAFLSGIRGSHTGVVTHGIFLKMLIAYLLYRNLLNASDYIKLSFFNASDNANVTICEYHPWKRFSRTRGWQVVSYNEKPRT